jgi:glutamyl-tRNA synthetase
MADTDQQAAAFAAEGRPQTVRLKIPRDGQCVIDDLVRGEVRFDWDKEQDTVIQRPDGSCLYHLASAIDDHDLEITHVVRAEEHLPNTPRQIFILDALGYERPKFAHLPYVAEPGGSAKLSKRKLAKYEQHKDFAQLLQHGRAIANRCGIATEADTFNPVIIDFYREIGFVPEAILNYLLLLGWSLDGETEKFTTAEMVRHFTLQRVNKAPASFDPKKLLAFQGTAFANLPPVQRTELARPFAHRAGLLDSPQSEELLPAVVAAAGDRMKMAGDIIEFDYFFLDAIQYDEKAFQKRICKPDNARDLLARLRDHLALSTEFDAAAVEASVNVFCDNAGIELKDVIHAIRIAVTGQAAGIGMFETLALLGQAKSLQRIDASLQLAATVCAGA